LGPAGIEPAISRALQLLFPFEKPFLLNPRAFSFGKEKGLCEADVITNIVAFKTRNTGLETQFDYGPKKEVSCFEFSVSYFDC